MESPKDVRSNQPVESDSCRRDPEVRSSLTGKKNNGNNAEIQEPTDEDAWDDMPELQSLSDDSDIEGSDLPDPEDEIFNCMLEEMLRSESPVKHYVDSGDLIERIQTVLTRCQPYPGDKEPVDPSYCPGERRFLIEKQGRGFICVYDRVQGFETDIHETRVQWGFFSIGHWFAERCAVNSGLHAPWDHARQWMLEREWEGTVIGFELDSPGTTRRNHNQPDEIRENTFELNGIQVDRNKYPALQRNAAQIKGKIGRAHV